MPALGQETCAPVGIPIHFCAHVLSAPLTSIRNVGPHLVERHRQPSASTAARNRSRHCAGMPRIAKGKLYCISINQWPSCPSACHSRKTIYVPRTRAKLNSNGEYSLSSATSSAPPAATSSASTCPTSSKPTPSTCSIINGENAAGGFGITPSHRGRALRPRRARHHHRQPHLGQEGNLRIHDGPGRLA